MPCKCVNIDFGTYENSVSVWTPWRMSNEKHRLVNIDSCIVHEVTSLWDIGIRTIESCCGHNKNEGYIMVEHSYVEWMKRLGYKHSNITPQPYCFIPMSNGAYNISLLSNTEE